jgi:hypothetical protein
VGVVTVTDNAGIRSVLRESGVSARRTVLNIFDVAWRPLLIALVIYGIARAVHADPTGPLIIWGVLLAGTFVIAVVGQARHRRRSGIEQALRVEGAARGLTAAVALASRDDWPSEPAKAAFLLGMLVGEIRRTGVIPAPEDLVRRGLDREEDPGD